MESDFPRAVFVFVSLYKYALLLRKVATVFVFQELVPLVTLCMIAKSKCNILHLYKSFMLKLSAWCIKKKKEKLKFWKLNGDFLIQKKILNVI